MLLKTLRNNSYFFDVNTRKVLFISPYFKQVIEENIISKTNFEKKGYKENSEQTYYNKKYQFLKNHGYFAPFYRRDIEESFVTQAIAKKQIKEIPQISIELTENCNLACKYCAYRELYNDYERTNKSLDIDKLSTLFSELGKYWINTPKKEVVISFYGGEPLLEIEKIKEIVFLLKKYSKYRTFTFQMTTNGTLLREHIDFLVRKKFKILISLDGNDTHNLYRTFTSGDGAYFTILENVLHIKEKYPTFFDQNIEFASVLHDKNDINSIRKFFKLTFDKYPLISSLNTYNIKSTKKDEFYKMFRPKEKPISIKKDDGSAVKVKRPNVKEIEVFISEVLKIQPESISDVVFEQNIKKMPARKTCLPFSKKLFITVNGKILPCENINHENPLGNTKNSKNKILNPENIAKVYNELMKKYHTQCAKCYISDFCFHCIFNVFASGKSDSCGFFYDRKKFANYLSNFLNYFELERHDLYDFILNKKEQ